MVLIPGGARATEVLPAFVFFFRGGTGADWDGDTVGVLLGAVVGEWDGERDGAREGAREGAGVGLALGPLLGCCVGADDGSLVGVNVGDFVTKPHLWFACVWSQPDIHQYPFLQPQVQPLPPCGAL